MLFRSGIVVVKALGGETIAMIPGARIKYVGALEQQTATSGTRLRVPPGSTIEYERGTFQRSEAFTMQVPADADMKGMEGSFVVPAQSFELIRGSSGEHLLFFARYPSRYLLGCTCIGFERGASVKHH